MGLKEWRPQEKVGPRRLGPRRLGPRRVEPRRVEPRRWGAQNFAFFFSLLPPQFSSFLLSLRVLTWNFGCLKRRGPEMCASGVLWLSCASPGGPGRRPLPKKTTLKNPPKTFPVKQKTFFFLSIKHSQNSFKKTSFLTFFFFFNREM